MKAKFILQNIFLKALIVPLLVVSLSGCIPVALVTVGAVGGFAAGRDTFEGILDNEESAVWDAAMEIIGIMGTIQDENENRGIIIANISGAKVTATISMAGKNAVKLSIRARKSMFPKMSIAQDVYVKINNYLNK